MGRFPLRHFLLCRSPLGRLMLASTALILLVGIFMTGVRLGRRETESKSGAALSELTQAIAADAQRALDEGNLPLAFALTQPLEEHCQDEFNRLREAYAAVMINKYNTAWDEMDLAQCRALLTRETILVLHDTCPGLVEQMKSQLKAFYKKEERPPVRFSLLSHQTTE